MCKEGDIRPLFSMQKSKLKVKWRKLVFGKKHKNFFNVVKKDVKR
jgi:hypothetical protein